jgi:hypothetical protein
MAASNTLTGQWVGQYTYGPEFGDEMYGQNVQFRLFLKDAGNGQFTGTSVDIEGFGANMDKATVNGFIDGNFISFTKEYPKNFIIDEDGHTHEDQANSHPRLSYSGSLDKSLNAYRGTWELWVNEVLDGERGSFVDIFTGTWEMKKDD